MLDSAGVLGHRLRYLMGGFVSYEKIRVVPNGTLDFDTRSKPPRDTPCVLFLSNLRQRKGIIPAFRAALLVLQQHREVKFIFAGAWTDEALERRLKNEATPWGDRLEFRSFVNDVEKRRLLAQATIFLFPPVMQEGHPRVVLEAMSAGLPIISTDRGAIAETIGPDAGFVLPEPDAGIIAARILKLLQDRQLRDRMGHAARARYLAEYTQEQADVRFSNWLTEVIA